MTALLLQASLSCRSESTVAPRGAARTAMILFAFEEKKRETPVCGGAWSMRTRPGTGDGRPTMTRPGVSTRRNERGCDIGLRMREWCLRCWSVSQPQVQQPV